MKHMLSKVFVSISHCCLINFQLENLNVKSINEQLLKSDNSNASEQM